MTFTLRQIAELDAKSKISAGHANNLPLKNFLKNEAWPFHESNIGKTYVLVNEDSAKKICGYITLMNSHISFSHENQKPEEPQLARKYPSYPAVKIARLLVDSNHRGMKLGSMMLAWAINHVRLAIVPHVGYRFIALDAKKDSVDFYLKNGFTLMTTKSNELDTHPVMFIDLNTYNNKPA